MTNLINISKLSKKRNTTIDAEKLLEYINYVEKTKKTYNSGGIKIEWINEKNVVDVDVQDVIKGDLDIEGTKVRTFKAKKVLGNILAKGVKTLEEIDVGIVIGNLFIEGTKVKKIKAKAVQGNINANQVKTLEEIEIEKGMEGNLNIKGTSVKKIKAGVVLGNIEMGNTTAAEGTKINIGIINGYLDIEKTNVVIIKVGYIKGVVIANGATMLTEMDVLVINDGLDIRGTSIDFQLDIIKKIEDGELEINGDIYFGGNIEGIEQLCDNENLTIPGDLYIKETNINFQKKILEKKKNGKLKINGELFSDIEI